ncbi:RIB43A-like with coiled-coils protein 2 [Trachymyrmex cornetzi]|uniref:RIB43A-like with coiled-coils protein 2 n=1 Tax=Trachymyrmex cornetzi TaxID=471704 RepID=A0A195DDK0_9HYME|nr:RIB43A-like with coiled-coils protein 2 [Trachymyrmex cornetzi]
MLHDGFAEFILARLHRGHCEAVQDDEDKKAEIYNHVTGDFLTEAREQAESTHGPHKPLTDRYKGMTTDELKVFRNAQLQQMEEIHVSMSGGITEVNKKIAEKNLWLAEQQKQHQEYLNRFVYKHQPTPDFYEQFNKGTR